MFELIKSHNKWGPHTHQQVGDLDVLDVNRRVPDVVVHQSGAEIVLCPVMTLIASKNDLQILNRSKLAKVMLSQCVRFRPRGLCV